MTLPHRTFRCLGVLLVAGLSPLTACMPPAEPIDAPLTAYEPLSSEAMKRPLWILANPRLGGRMTGTPGHDSAAKYIAKEFRNAGLVGGMADDDFYQEFVVGELRQPGSLCSLTIGEETLKLGRDFYPMAASSQGAFDGPICFAGYGLRYGLKMYDDYEDLSVSEAVVMILHAEPHDADGRSLWRRGGWTRMASLDYKLRKAADLGATGALVVTPPTLGEVDPLYNVMPTNRRGKLPAMRISRDVANRILASTGKDWTVESAARAIRETEQPVTGPTPLTAEGTVDLTPGYGQNVVGILPASPERFGKTDIPRPAVVIGAHYDHLSVMGYARSRDAGWAVRPGANDNASGVAVLIQLAKALSRVPQRRCDYVFAAFSGEEIGFVGSKHYVNHPVLPLSRTAVMLNLDQVGRMAHERLIVIGSVLDAPFATMLPAANTMGANLKITAIPVKNSSYWSDNAPFVYRRVPTLFFFAGLTRDYHTRADVREKINLEGMSRTGRLVMDMVRIIDATFGPPPMAAN
ncbi:MAG: M28 family peptidase [Planctomycetes bacterium]|nr:M28 family peptidase [Planctomycetota bacterium]